MSRAGHLDLYVELGTDYRRRIQVFRPDDVAEPVENLAAGDRIFYHGAPHYIARIDPAPLGNIRLALGRGTFYDPAPVVKPGRDMAFRAVPRKFGYAVARWAPDLEAFGLDVPGTVELPTTIDPSTSEAVDIVLDRTWLDDVQAAIDYAGAGPSLTVGAWDLIVALGASSDRVRIVEGLVTFVRSTAAATIPNPNP